MFTRHCYHGPVPAIVSAAAALSGTTAIIVNECVIWRPDCPIAKLKAPPSAMRSERPAHTILTAFWSRRVPSNHPFNVATLITMWPQTQQVAATFDWPPSEVIAFVETIFVDHQWVTNQAHFPAGSNRGQ